MRKRRLVCSPLRGALKRVANFLRKLVEPSGSHPADLSSKPKKPLAGRFWFGGEGGIRTFGVPHKFNALQRHRVQIVSTEEP